MCVPQALEPHKKRLLKDVTLYIERAYYSNDDTVARLAGYVYEHAEDNPEQKDLEEKDENGKGKPQAKSRASSEKKK